MHNANGVGSSDFSSGSSQGASPVQTPNPSISSDENKPDLQQVTISKKILSPNNQTSINCKNLPFYDRKLKKIQPNTKLSCSDIQSEDNIINQDDYQYQRYKLQSHDAIAYYKNGINTIENRIGSNFYIQPIVFLDMTEDLRPPIQLTINNTPRMLPPQSEADMEFFTSLDTDKIKKLIHHLTNNFDSFYKTNFTDMGYDRSASEDKLKSAKKEGKYEEDNRQLILEIPGGFIKVKVNDQDDTSSRVFASVDGEDDIQARPIPSQPMSTTASEDNDLIDLYTEIPNPVVMQGNDKKTVIDKAGSEQDQDEGVEILISQLESNNQQASSISPANAGIKPSKKSVSRQKEEENIEAGSRLYIESTDRLFVEITANLDL